MFYICWLPLFKLVRSIIICGNCLWGSRDHGCFEISCNDMTMLYVCWFPPLFVSLYFRLSMRLINGMFHSHPIFVCCFVIKKGDSKEWINFSRKLILGRRWWRLYEQRKDLSRYNKSYITFIICKKENWSQE